MVTARTYREMEGLFGLVPSFLRALPDAERLLGWGRDARPIPAGGSPREGRAPATADRWTTRCRIGERPVQILG